MIGDSETMSWGMVALAVISILAIFGSAWWAVGALRKGNSRFRWRQSGQQGERVRTKTGDDS